MQRAEVWAAVRLPPSPFEIWNKVSPSAMWDCCVWTGWRVAEDGAMNWVGNCGQPFDSKCINMCHMTIYREMCASRDETSRIFDSQSHGDKPAFLLSSYQAAQWILDTLASCWRQNEAQWADVVATETDWRWPVNQSIIMDKRISWRGPPLTPAWCGYLSWSCRSWRGRFPSRAFEPYSIRVDICWPLPMATSLLL